MRSMPQQHWPELYMAPSISPSTAASRFGVGAHVAGILAAELQAEC